MLNSTPVGAQKWGQEHAKLKAAAHAPSPQTRAWITRAHGAGKLMTSWSPRSKPRRGWGLTRYRDDGTWGTWTPRGPGGCALSGKSRIGWDSLLSDTHRDQRVAENFQKESYEEEITQNRGSSELPSRALELLGDPP